MFLPLHGKSWKQVHSKSVSICHNPDSQKELLDRLDSDNVTNFDFSSTMYSNPLREIKKLVFKKRDRLRFSSCRLPFKKKYNPHLTQKVFELFAVSSRKSPMYTKKTIGMRLSAVNFIKKSRSKSYNEGIVDSRVGF